VTNDRVFEVTIRVLGGLLSAHIFASDPQYGFNIDWYNDQLLDLARRLGNRLMPAFNTPTGLPWPRVNLRSGVLPYEVQEACTAGAGTLLIEFGMLSRLTGDDKYEKAAKKALMAVWERRSHMDLFGTTMSLNNKQWLDKTTGIGASSDSFHEVIQSDYSTYLRHTSFLAMKHTSTCSTKRTAPF
jgi:ER degradation enhancer, mannosidase alpha-like 1